MCTERGGKIDLLITLSSLSGPSSVLKVILTYFFTNAKNNCVLPLAWHMAGHVSGGAGVSSALCVDMST